MERSGRNVWPTAQILTWSDLVERLHRESRELGRHPQRWIDPATARLIWDSIVRDEASSGAPLMPKGLAHAAHRSWVRLNEYLIPDHAIDRLAGPEQATFARWVRTYRDWLAGANGTDVALGPGPIDHAAIADLRLALTGFDELTPQQRRFVRSTRDVGVEIPVLTARAHESAVQVRACASRAAEYDAAARWAAVRIVREPASTIAIVVDALSTERERIQRSLDGVLAPATSLTGGPAPGTLAYTIASARPLSAQPMVRAALEILAVFCGRPDSRDVATLVRSAFVAGAAQEGSRRALLDARLRERPGRLLSLHALASSAATHGADTLCAILRAALERRSAWPANAAPSRWSLEFSSLLEAFGWPALPLDSPDWQTRERWLGLLGSFGGCDALATSVDAFEALRMLTLLADDALFEPEQPAAPVVVIDPRSCAGMQFDALWICGMDSDSWPAAAVPDPFLPWEWQRERRIPGTTADACERDASVAFVRLGHSARRVVASHARADGDALLLPSPLLHGLEPADVADSGTHSTWARSLWDRRPALERHTESAFPALTVPVHVRGGSTLLANESACPFRAQAIHRLGCVPLDGPRVGVDAATRGRLMHTVLERVWAELRDSAGLAASAPVRVEELVDEAISAALGPLIRGSEPLFSRMLELEARWLRDRVLELLELDLERPPFTVAGREEARDLELEGVRVTLKLDRIDRLASGELAVIDYKTSSSSDPASWTGERPELPQLPAYVLALGAERVVAVAFAGLRTGGTAYSGLVRDPDLWPGLGRPRGSTLREFDSWETMLALWRRRLGTLLAEFRDGDATLAFDPASACERCHVGVLCRISEVRGVRAEADEDERGTH